MYHHHKNLNDFYCLANNHLGKLVLLIKSNNAYAFEDLFELGKNIEQLEKELEEKNKEIEDDKVELNENKKNLIWGIISIIVSLLFFFLLFLNFMSISFVFLTIFYLGSMGYIVRLLIRLYKNIKNNNLNKLLDDKEKLLAEINIKKEQLEKIIKEIDLQEISDKQVIDEIIARFNNYEDIYDNVPINDTDITLARKSPVDK